MSTVVRSATLVNALEDLIPLGVEPGDVLLMLNIRYPTALKSLARIGRRDLVEKLHAWKKSDSERLQRALGRAWL